MRRSPICLVALTLACSKPADAPREEPATVVVDPAAAEPEAPPIAAKVDTAKVEPPSPPTEPAIVPSTPRLLIADSEGLHEYDFDGKRLATLVTGPARAPRVLADGRVVFLRSESEAKLELWMYTPGGEAKRLAKLPQRWNGETCKAELGRLDEYDAPLDLQAPGDFRLDPTKQEACIRLQDRNDNMADFGVAVWVEFGEGKLRQEAILDLEGECAPGEEAGHCYGLALAREQPPAAAATFAYAYESETGKLTGPDGSTAKICRKGDGECAQVERRSPSGRFELLSGEVDGGDYIYREVVVLDRQTGKLSAIGSSEPSTLLAIEPREVFGKLHDAWLAIPGESDVRWLVDDRLWIDGLLIDPSKSTILKIPGDLAFRLDS